MMSPGHSPISKGILDISSWSLSTFNVWVLKTKRVERGFNIWMKKRKLLEYLMFHQSWYWYKISYTCTIYTNQNCIVTIVLLADLEVSSRVCGLLCILSIVICDVSWRFSKYQVRGKPCHQTHIIFRYNCWKQIKVMHLGIHGIHLLYIIGPVNGRYNDFCRFIFNIT